MAYELRKREMVKDYSDDGIRVPKIQKRPVKKDKQLYELEITEKDAQNGCVKVH